MASDLKWVSKSATSKSSQFPGRSQSVADNISARPSHITPLQAGADQYVTQLKEAAFSVASPPIQRMMDVDEEVPADNAEHGAMGNVDNAAASWVEVNAVYGLVDEAALNTARAFSATTARVELIGKGVIQGAFGAGNSGPKDYATSSGTALKDVMYTRSAAGYIEFTAPDAITTPAAFAPARQHNNTDISDPADGTKLNLILPGGIVPTLKNSSRSQHFKVANREAGTVGQHGSGSSPANYTWHHKLAPGRMVLVDRMVHSKHGHNGGVHLW